MKLCSKCSLRCRAPKHSWCSQCRNKAAVSRRQTDRDKHRALARGYQKKAYSRNRKIIKELKNKPCMDCKQVFPTFCMDFDHRDPKDKKIGVAVLAATASAETLLEEIAKCDVVCANCHRIRTHGDTKHYD